MRSIPFYAAIVTVLIFTLVTLGCGQSMSRTYVYKSSSKQGWLGVGVQDVNQRLKEKKHLDVDAGAYVSNVVENSPADDAGIQEGDVILRFDGKTIDDSDDLTRVVRRTKPKTEVKIDIARGKERKTIAATVSRVSTPEAYSFNFNGRNFAPRIPMQPFNLHMFTSQSLYGMEVQALSKQLGEYFEVPDSKGVLVTEVEKGSDAEKAGFKAGDVITKVGKDRVRDMDALRDEFSDNDDKSVQVEVYRKGKAISLTLEATNDGDDDEEDSGALIAPQGSDRWRMYDGEPFPAHQRVLSNLREHLRQLAGRLKDDMHRLKERLREDLHNL